MLIIESASLQAVIMSQNLVNLPSPQSYHAPEAATLRQQLKLPRAGPLQLPPAVEVDLVVLFAFTVHVFLSSFEGCLSN